MHEVFLTLPEVCASIRLQKSWINEAIQRGDFPAPIHLTSRNTVWIESQVEDWKAARIAEAVAQIEKCA